MSGLRDQRARALLLARLHRFAEGLPGDIEPLGDGVYEMRIHFGPGYRIYYLHHGRVFVVLLCGGDKGTQKRDLESAKRIAREWRETHV